MKAFFIGQREYLPVLRLQETIFNAKIRRQSQIRRKEIDAPLLPDVNILVEHASPVYTLGRRDTSEGLPAQPTDDVQVVKTKRGGGVTYHGPGQLTMYPIANLEALWKKCTAAKPRSPIEWFSSVLEQAMMDTALEFGIPSHPFKTGIWADELPSQVPRKLGSIGLQLGSNWVSMHGAGLNVHTDLSYFDRIIMCELPGRSATSIAVEMACRKIASVPARGLKVAEVVPLLHTHFIKRLHQSVELKSTVTDLSMVPEWETKVLTACDAELVSSRDH